MDDLCNVVRITRVDRVKNGDVRKCGVKKA